MDHVLSDVLLDHIASFLVLNPFCAADARAWACTSTAVRRSAAERVRAHFPRCRLMRDTRREFALRFFNGALQEGDCLLLKAMFAHGELGDAASVVNAAEHLWFSNVGNHPPHYTSEEDLVAFFDALPPRAFPSLASMSLVDYDARHTRVFTARAFEHLLRALERGAFPRLTDLAFDDTSPTGAMTGLVLAPRWARRWSLLRIPAVSIAAAHIVLEAVRAHSARIHVDTIYCNCEEEADALMDELHMLAASDLDSDSDGDGLTS